MTHDGDGDGIGRVRLFVTGRVQGVFFRARTQEQARRHNLGGWVRNLPDGRVEIVAQGEHRALQELIDWCRQGPRFAIVTNVEIIEEPPGATFSSFDIRY